MKQILNDEELKDWFLKFCKENQGCYVINEEEKAEITRLRDSVKRLLRKYEQAEQETLEYVNMFDDAETNFDMGQYQAFKTIVKDLKELLNGTTI